MRRESSSNTSPDNSLDDVGYPPLFRYAEARKWRKLKSLLKKNKDMCSKRDRTGLSLFNVAIVSGAPLHILDAILNIDPSQAYTPDSFGATPLHVACLNGASPKGIEYLVRLRGDLVWAPDIDRRIPLHHAVECICRNDISFDDGIEVIRLLAAVDSSTIHTCDRNSHSPVDIVQIARTSNSNEEEQGRILDQLCEIMLEMSKLEYRRKKACWENKGFDRKCHNFDENEGTCTTVTNASTLHSGSLDLNDDLML